MFCGGGSKFRMLRRFITCRFSKYWYPVLSCQYGWGLCLFQPIFLHVFPDINTTDMLQAIFLGAQDPDVETNRSSSLYGNCKHRSAPMQRCKSFFFGELRIFAGFAQERIWREEWCAMTGYRSGTHLRRFSTVSPDDVGFPECFGSKEWCSLFRRILQNILARLSFQNIRKLSQTIILRLKAHSKLLHTNFHPDPVLCSRRLFERPNLDDHFLFSQIMIFVFAITLWEV